MKTTEITINNVNRSRSFGWGYSYKPTDNGSEIDIPSSPVHTGTLNQINDAIRADRTLNAHSNCYRNDAWFYKGNRIVATYTVIVDGDTAKWGWAAGFVYEGEESLTIRIEEA